MRENYFAILLDFTTTLCAFVVSLNLTLSEKLALSQKSLLFVYFYTSSPPRFVLLSHFVSSAVAAEEEEEKTKPTRTGEGSFAALT